MARSLPIPSEPGPQPIRIEVDDTGTRFVIPATHVPETYGAAAFATLLSSFWVLLWPAVIGDIAAAMAAGFALLFGILLSRVWDLAWMTERIEVRDGTLWITRERPVLTTREHRALADLSELLWLASSLNRAIAGARTTPQPPGAAGGGKRDLSASPWRFGT